MTCRKKPGVAFWATVVVVVLLVLYPLSWGPQLWLMMSGHVPVWTDRLYNPLRYALERAPQGVTRAADAYLEWWGGPDPYTELSRRLNQP